MASPPGQPLPELVATSGQRLDYQVNWVAATGSTNSDVAAYARAGGPEGFVLLADEQTAGKGRLARVWASPAGASVSMSVLLRPAADLAQWGWLSLIAGMALTRAVASLGDARVELKWPNDALVNGKKICGILSERVETPTGPAAVVGIGINLTLGEDELPVPHATSLRLAGLPTARDEVARRVLDELAVGYTHLVTEGPPVEEYTALCASVGAELTVTTADAVITGVGVGVDEAGRLLVDVAGQTRAFAVGDVVHAKLPG